MAAAQVAMVDHLVQGRLVLGVGPGLPADAEAIGNLGSDRNRKTQEALDHMRRIWSEEPPYRIEGEFYRTTTERSFDPKIGVGVAIRRLQRPHPPNDFHRPLGILLQDMFDAGTESPNDRLNSE